MEAPPFEVVADEIDYAFVGRQVALELLDEPVAIGRYASWDVELTFEVLRVYKGDVTNPDLVYSEQSDCGLDYDGRGTIGVLAYDVDGVPTVAQCQWFRADEDLLQSVYGAPRDAIDVAPDLDVGASSEEDSDSWIVVVAAAVSIGLALFVVFGRRGRRAGNAD